MSNGNILDIIVTFKASEKEVQNYERYWRCNGFRNRSDFLRQAADAAMYGNINRSPLLSGLQLKEINVHLDRTAAAIMDLVVCVSNDNWVGDDDIQSSLYTALNDISIMRKRYK